MESFACTPRTIRLLWRSDPARFLLATVCAVVLAALPVAMTYVGKLIVDGVVAARLSEPPPANFTVVGPLLTVVGIELLLVAALGVLELIGEGWWQALGLKTGTVVVVDIMKKTLAIDFHAFDSSELYDKLVRARCEATTRPAFLVQQYITIFRSTVMLLGFAALLLPLSPWIIVLLFASCLPALAVEARFSGSRVLLRNKTLPETRRLTYLEQLVTDKRYHKEMRIFDLGKQILQRYTGLSGRVVEEEVDLIRRRIKWSSFSSLFATGIFYACYVYIIVLTCMNRITLGDLTLYMVALRQGRATITATLITIGMTCESNLYMRNLFEFMDTEVAPRTSVVETFPCRQGITFEGVEFRYRGAQKCALRGLSLNVPAGKTFGLVGVNGAGKTTFIKLLSKLYEPTRGRILVDGRDLRDIHEEQWRKQIAIIFQDFNQYEFSFRDNVGFGAVDHIGDTDRVMRAAEKGGISDLVKGMQRGIDTPLGRMFDDGIELSGGQWQRVALARAFMREESAIVVLDEPTAALDPSAEIAAYERFRRFSQGKTAIIISHRFPAVRYADRIAVLDQGEIVEQGTHEELLSRNGVYAKLFRLQAAGYS